MTNFLSVKIDGASRGNPGDAGIGVLIQNDEGKTLEEISEFIGENKTNNQAEYSALIRALETCKNLGEKVRILSDSELLVKQMNGEYSVNNRVLKRKFRKAKDLEKNFQKVIYEHIPREKNPIADSLANKAIDKK